MATGFKLQKLILQQRDKVITLYLFSRVVVHPADEEKENEKWNTRLGGYTILGFEYYCQNQPSERVEILLKVFH